MAVLTPENTENKHRNSLPCNKLEFSPCSLWSPWWAWNYTF